MKIGTKTNVINDLGIFAGSKMTIKVNGKQIYPQKRYSIVRVDDKCPIIEDLGYCDDVLCDDCKFKENYGDTKEQLVRKITQALLIDQIERYRKAPNCDVNQTIIEHEYRICLEKARKIIKFLGVEE